MARLSRLLLLAMPIAFGIVAGISAFASARSAAPATPALTPTAPAVEPPAPPAPPREPAPIDPPAIAGPAPVAPAAAGTPAAAAPSGGHVAPPKPPVTGPDLRPVPAQDPAGGGERLPAVFFPDPLRFLPETDAAGLLRSEEAPNTFTPGDPEERRQMIEFGRELFFSTTAFGQRPSEGPQVFGERLSCATCHSGEGFTDNRTHPVGPTDERPLAPRATPHLLEIKNTAPFGWDGRNENLEEQARGAITSNLEMNASREPNIHELRAIAVFVEEGIKAPEAIPGKDFDPEMAAKGEAVFKAKKGVDPLGEFSPNVKISCETCHLGPDFTDNLPHRILSVDEFIDPGKVDDDNNIRGFDTPPLRGLRFTAPYFHQNAAGDPTAPNNLVTGKDFARRALRDNVINFYNARFAFNYTNEEMDNLTEFLLSL